MAWKPFKTAPKDGTLVISGFPARKALRTQPPISITTLEHDIGNVMIAH